MNLQEIRIKKNPIRVIPCFDISLPNAFLCAERQF